MKNLSITNRWTEEAWVKFQQIIINETKNMKLKRLKNWSKYQSSKTHFFARFLYIFDENEKLQNWRTEEKTSAKNTIKRRKKVLHTPWILFIQFISHQFLLLFFTKVYINWHIWWMKRMISMLLCKFEHCPFLKFNRKIGRIFLVI